MGATHTYRVLAVNGIGVGKASAIASVRTYASPGAIGFQLVTPAAPGNSGSAPAFTINRGELVATSTTVTLDFDVDPTTVRGYAVSLDPTFALTSILSLDQRFFSLPAVPGTYVLYLKYFSTTGHPSPVVTRTVTYETTAPVSSLVYSFQRPLRLGSFGEDVKVLQAFLNSQGFFVGNKATARRQETGYFGPLTAAALARFQEAHAAMILAPIGLTRGTGVFGTATRKTVMELMMGR